MEAAREAAGGGEDDDDAGLGVPWTMVGGPGLPRMACSAPVLPGCWAAHKALTQPLKPVPGTPPLLPLQVGQQPLELLRIATLRDFIRCDFAEFLQDAPAAKAAGPAAGASAAAAGAGAGGGAGAVGSAAAGSAASPSSGSASASSLSSRRSSFEGEGEIDLITGEKKKVDPSVLRRRAKQAAREAAAAAAEQVAREAAAQEQAAREAAAQEQATAASVAGSGSSGGYDLERILDDVACLTFVAGVAGVARGGGDLRRLHACTLQPALSSLPPVPCHSAHNRQRFPAPHPLPRLLRPALRPGGAAGQV